HLSYLPALRPERSQLTNLTIPVPIHFHAGEGTGMAERYFYTHAATDHGPYSAGQMRAIANAGQILTTDLVWKEGTTQRVAASQIRNLYPAVAPVIAVPPLTAGSVTGTDGAAFAPPPAAASGAVPLVPAAPHKPSDAHERPKRVTTIRGGTLCGQDGTTVRFKKKCEKCGHEDQTRSSAAIRVGSM